MDLIRAGLLVVLLAPLADGQGFHGRKPESFGTAYQKHRLDQLLVQSHVPRPDSSLDVLGHWGWGPCWDVAPMGNYVLTGSGPTLLWLDVSDTHRPIIVWETLTEAPVTYFLVRDSIGYAVNSEAFLTLDFRNPSAPVIRAHFHIASGLVGLTLEDSLAFIKQYGSYIYCVNVADPSSPYLRATIADGTLFGKLAISNRNLYNTDQFLNVTEHFDVSNLDSVRMTVLWNVVPMATSIWTRDTLLLLGSYDDQLHIYSISVPNSPVELSHASLGFPEIISITLQGDTAFAYAADGHVVVVTIEDRRNPVAIGTYTPPITQPSLTAVLAARDTILFCAHANGLETYSIANPAEINVLSFFPTGDESEHIAVKDDIAYVTSGYAGLWVVNVSDPAHPRRIGNLQTPGYAYDIIVDSTIGYLSLNDPNYPPVRKQSTKWCRWISVDRIQ